jgi:hypothetical protein
VSSITSFGGFGIPAMIASAASIRAVSERSLLFHARIFHALGLLDIKNAAISQQRNLFSFTALFVFEVEELPENDDLSSAHLYERSFRALVLAGRSAKTVSDTWSGVSSK